MKYTLLSFCLLAFLISCGSISSSSDRFKNVDVADVVKETDISSISTSNCKTIRMSRDDEHILKTSDLFDSVEYIPLSNDPDAIIGNVTKVVVSHNSFFVHDRWKTKSVKRFALDGKYIATIGCRGEGPQEYADATDFTIQDSMVLLYDSFQDKINYYDLNGNFIKSKKTKFVFNTFRAINSDLICYEVLCDNPHIKSINNYNLIITDTSYNILHKAIYNHAIPRQHQSFNSQITNNDKIYYSRLYSDTIYSINQKGNICVEYNYKFDKPILPFSIQQTDDIKLLNKEVNSNSYVTISDYKVTNDFVFVKCINERRFYYNVYSKNTCKIKSYKGRAVEFDNALLGIGPYIATEGNTLIGYIMPCDWYDIDALKDFVKDNPKLKILMNKATKEDNPILVLAHIGDF